MIRLLEKCRRVLGVVWLLGSACLFWTSTAPWRHDYDMAADTVSLWFYGIAFFCAAGVLAGFRLAHYGLAIAGGLLSLHLLTFMLFVGPGWGKLPLALAFGGFFFGYANVLIYSPLDRLLPWLLKMSRSLNKRPGREPLT